MNSQGEANTLTPACSPIDLQAPGGSLQGRGAGTAVYFPDFRAVLFAICDEAVSCRYAVGDMFFSRWQEALRLEG